MGRSGDRGDRGCRHGISTGDDGDVVVVARAYVGLDEALGRRRRGCGAAATRLWGGGDDALGQPDLEACVWQRCIELFRPPRSCFFHGPDKKLIKKGRHGVDSGNLRYLAEALS